MKFLLSLLCLSVLALAADPAPAIPQAFVEAATTIAPAGTARPTAIAALHAHVRDRIAEAPTQWS